MSFAIIKLKKVKNKVKFAPDQIIAPLTAKCSKSTEFCTNPLKNRVKLKRRAPRKKNANKAESLLEIQRKTSQNFRRITEDINNIGKEIENMTNSSIARPMVTDRVQRSITPPSGFKITKQSFPSPNLHLPKILVKSFN